MSLFRRPHRVDSRPRKTAAFPPFLPATSDGRALRHLTALSWWQRPGNADSQVNPTASASAGVPADPQQQPVQHAIAQDAFEQAQDLRRSGHYVADPRSSAFQAVYDSLEHRLGRQCAGDRPVRAQACHLLIVGLRVGAA